MLELSKEHLASIEECNNLRASCIQLGKVIQDRDKTILELKAEITYLANTINIIKENQNDTR